MEIPEGGEINDLLNKSSPHPQRPASPTSEVGCEESSPDRNIDWEKMCKSQMEIVNQLLRQKGVNPAMDTAHPQQTFLPEYNPETPHSNAKAWCNAVDVLMREIPLRGAKLAVALNRALKGSASQWFVSVIKDNLEWEEFRTNFLSRYAHQESAVSTLVSIGNGRARENESLVTYANRLVSEFVSCLTGKSTEQTAINLTLVHLTKDYPRVRRLAFSTDIETTDQMTKQLSAISFKKPGPAADDAPEAKKPRLYCTYCRRSGHHIDECRSKRTPTLSPKERRSEPRPRTERQPSSRQDGPGRMIDVTCYRCQGSGHYASKCPQRKSSQGEKRVGLCAAKPIGRLEHNGEHYSFLFDSGSECSLMVASLASKITGTRRYEVVTLHGLGNSTVLSTSQIEATVAITGIEINLVFHIIPDEYLSDAIIIGREILSDHIGVVIDKNRCYLQSRTVPSNSIETIEGSPSHPVTQTANVGQVGDLIILPRPSLENKTEGSETSGSLERRLEVNLCNDSNISNNVVPTHNDYDSIVTELSPADRLKLFSILDKYKSFFINGIPKTRVKTGEMKIRLKEPSKINFQRPYKLGPEKQKIVRNLISDLLKAKVIRPSSSPYSSPAFPVPKGTGDYRLCVDYRALNENTVPEHFPLPLIQDQIARLSGAKFYISLDMASGYHQIPVHADSVEKTSFITYHGTWEYLAVPFGLRNAGSVFQRAVTEALGDLAHDYVIVFVDDILVVAKSPDQALERLDTVLKVLTDAGFSLNLKKCRFVVKRITYLGYEIENGEIRPNSKKIDSLTKLPPPGTIRSLRQFLGLASYFRQFIKNFSQITAPMHRLIAEANSLDSKIIQWLPEHEEIRQKLISLLTSSPVLVIFDPSLPIELHTDASSAGYAGILINIVHSKPRAVAYFSKRTTPAESKYHSYELETMAVVKSIEHFNNYLQGNKFRVITDCLSLKATQAKKDLIPRVQRWWSFLQSYHFTIEYRKAERMAHVDFLSRNPIDFTQETNSSFPPISKALDIPPIEAQNREKSRTCNKNSDGAQAPVNLNQRRVNLTTVTPDWLLVEQSKDSELSKIKDQVKNSNDENDNLRYSYEIRSGILCRKIQRNGTTRCLPIVPHTLKWAIVNNIHNSIFHMGWEKTVETLYNHYWFEKRSKFTRKFVENCLTCKVNKSDSGARQIRLHPIPKTSIPWHTVHLDVTGKLTGKNDSKEYLFVFVDAFTKYTLLSHTKRIDAESATRALSHAIDLFGPPSLLIVDQGRSFANKNSKEFCSKSQIELHFIATGACRANGQVERQMRVLKNMLTIAEAEENKCWQQAVGEIQLAINSTPHRVTKFSPMELMFGRVSRPRNLIVAEGDISDRDEIDLSQIRAQANAELENSAIYSKTQFDKGKATVKPFAVGDSVLLKNEERNQTKLDPKYKGPFIIKKVLDHDRYEIASSEGKRVFKYPHDRLCLVPNTKEINPSLDLSDGED
ncbi:hypothetical protein M8J77_007259 [Diaphorina citri]|nr:hypothetical protein M8J77_007259 [Diaphorina citri]